MTTLTYREACREALRDALMRDPRVFLMGEDVGRYGGCFAVSMGLHAAGVAAIAVLRQLTFLDPSSPFAYVVGTYDGVIGWAALVWFSVITAGYAMLMKRGESGARTPVANGRMG